jgi:hypothetical protein
MALEFKKEAMQFTPRGPRCFRSWSGSLLIPELLFALKWWWSTSVSSFPEMCAAWGSVSGWNTSGGMVAS